MSTCNYCGTQQCQGNCAAISVAAQGYNYGQLQQSYINQALKMNLDADEDYRMFKKYAHLSEQEMMEAFLGEQKEMERQAEEGAKMLVQKAKDRNEAAKKEFWKWCAKYRKHMTEERFNTYFKMFL